jgi:hypothetical protein
MKRTQISQVAFWMFVLACFAGPAMAQVAVPCDSFQRNVTGAWTAVEPATIDVWNGTLEVMPGHLVGANVASILDRQCR